MKKLKRLAFLFLSTIYGLWLLLTVLGGLAPWLSVHLVPIIQLLPAIVVFGLPLHMLALWMYKGKSTKGILAALLGVFLCIWIGTKDWKQSDPPTTSDPSHNLQLVSYNIRNFNFSGSHIDSVLKVVKPLKADVICFQEFRNYRTREKGPRATAYLAKELGLPHYVHLRSGKFYQGTALFSRYPIQQLDTLFLSGQEANNGFLATLSHPDGPIGIANFHLTSFQFTSIHPDSNSVESRFRRLVRNGSERIPQHQALLEEVIEQTQSYPHPLILAADMNSAPHSRIPCLLHAHFRDAFTEAGHGLGWTFPFWNALGVRIDYQWLNEQVTPLEVKVIRAGQSDHYPLMGRYRVGDRSGPVSVD